MRTLLAAFISIGLALASAGLSAEVGGGARLKDIAALQGPAAMKMLPAISQQIIRQAVEMSRAAIRDDVSRGAFRRT